MTSSHNQVLFKNTFYYIKDSVSPLIVQWNVTIPLQKCSLKRLDLLISKSNTSTQPLIEIWGVQVEKQTKKDILILNNLSQLFQKGKKKYEHGCGRKVFVFGMWRAQFQNGLHFICIFGVRGDEWWCCISSSVVCGPRRMYISVLFNCHN